MIENNTSNVFAAFKILIEEIETEIDLITKVGTIAWERRDFGGANEAGERATLVTAYRDRVVSLRNEWQALTGAQEGKTEEKIMSLKAHNYEPELVTGAKPTTVSILGQSFAVRYWRDVFERVMNTTVDLRPEKFEQILQQFPHFVGRDKKKFREPRKLKNGIFIQVNLSAFDIMRNCSQVLEMVGLSTKDFVVVTTQKKDGQTLRITIPPGH